MSLPDSFSDPKVSIILPVKDENPGVVSRFVCELEAYHEHVTYSYEVVVVDDGSKEKCPVGHLRSEVSYGYGAALMAGIHHSLGEVIVTADGDGQHRVRDIFRIIEFLQDFPEIDMVIGDRRLKEPSLRRYLGRKFLNIVASVFAWRWIPDLNSGLRGIRRKPLMGYLPILCPKFSFTTSLTMSMLTDGYYVDWLPIRVLPRPAGKSHVKVFQDGWTTLWYIVWIGGALRTRGLRAWLRKR